MRRFALVLAVLIALAIPVIVFPTRGVGWISGEELVAGFLRGPLLLLSLGLCVYACFRIRSKRGRGESIALLIIAATFPVALFGTGFIYQAGFNLYWNHKNAWFAMADYINPRLLQYSLDHPERFHRKVDTMEVDVDGFIESLRSDPTFGKSGIRIRKNQILDPWGRPISLMLGYPSRAGETNELFAGNDNGHLYPLSWIGTTEPVDAVVGIMLGPESEHAIGNIDYITARNGYKVRKP